MWLNFVSRETKLQAWGLRAPLVDFLLGASGEPLAHGDGRGFGAVGADEGHRGEGLGIESGHGLLQSCSLGKCW